VSYQYSEVDKSPLNKCAPPPAQTPSLSGPGGADGANGGVPSQIYCQAGQFYGFDAYGQYANFTGEKFPSAPVWQANVDGEYDWKIHDDVTAFIGADLSYVSSTNSFFVNRNPMPAFLNIGANGPDPVNGGYISGYNANGTPIMSATPVGPLPTNHANDPTVVPGHALLDLRAGVEQGPWRFQVWGRNVTNTWYWTGAYHVNDVLLRYTGMPTTIGFTLSYKYH
jgi:hypothetical protein